MLIALDLGTTGVRALVVSADGRVIARAHRALPTAFPQPGWVEQDPAVLWDSSVSVLQEARAAAGVAPGDVAALGVVTQRATVCAWDARSGAPLAPAIGWQDVRTAERVAELRAAGIPITTMASALKIAWWLEHDDAVRAAAEAGTLRVGTPDSWLTWQLTAGAAHVTDPGQASCTGLFDTTAQSWSAPLAGLFGAPLEPLPQVVPTAAVVGETPRDLLGAPVPVAARAGDQQAAAFGQGVHAKGDAKLTLGTAAMLDVHTGDELAEPPPASFPLALWRLATGPVEFCLEGQVITAGAAVDWLASLGVAEDAAEIERLARSVDSSAGVCFVPALQGLGTPAGDDTVRGVLSGLHRGATRAHLARAVLEGVAQRCTDLTDALGVAGSPLRVDGGLGRSDVLLETLAGLSGCELLRAQEIEATGLGAALLAGLATGQFSSASECAAVLPEPQRFSASWSAERRAEARERWAHELARARS